MKRKLPVIPGGMCRICFNEHYETSLNTEECLYETFRNTCAVCKENKNILRGFKIKGKLKLLFGHKKAYYIDVPDEEEEENTYF